MQQTGRDACFPNIRTMFILLINTSMKENYVIKYSIWIHDGFYQWKEEWKNINAAPCDQLSRNQGPHLQHTNKLDSLSSKYVIK